MKRITIPLFAILCLFVLTSTAFASEAPGAGLAIEPVFTEVEPPSAQCEMTLEEPAQETIPGAGSLLYLDDDPECPGNPPVPSCDTFHDCRRECGGLQSDACVNGCCVC